MVYNTEAIRTAMTRYGNKAMTGEQVRWGMENLNLTQEKLTKLGFKGFMQAHRITCEDHEGGGPVIFQQWDGKKWKLISDWYTPMYDIVRKLVMEEAAKYAKENKITPRDCSKEG
jgi:branched-chain amino acid transport system substrate-binding protein